MSDSESARIIHHGHHHHDLPPPLTPAEVQFQTSSTTPVPKSWTGKVWAIRNDYPDFSIYPTGLPPALPLPEDPDRGIDAPWMKFDYEKEPLKYAEIVKEYCWDGNRSQDFIPQQNSKRAWYHAAWMHDPKVNGKVVTGGNGREPLKGLTFERSIPPLEFASTQTNALQNWAVGFYNTAGASVFGKVWANQNDPQWSSHLLFPEGACTFKLLLTTASDEQVPTMVGAPSWPAVIAKQPDPKVAPKNGKDRNDFHSEVRLIQVDWAVRDPRSAIGWVFGTFMYNGWLDYQDPWDRLTPVGVQWGNDPTLNQAAFEAGGVPKESYINPEAEDVRKKLGGSRPSWGWNGRLNGPADNFISACASCHSTAQDPRTSMTQKVKKVDGKYVPEDDTKTMNFFRNIPAGEPFTQPPPPVKAADYSLQLMIGWGNYQDWKKAQQTIEIGGTFERLPPGRRVVFRSKPGAPGHLEQHMEDFDREEEASERTGQIMKYD